MVEQTPEEFEKWLEEQKGNTNLINIHKGNATKKEWLELLEWLEENNWDYDELI